MRPDIPVDLRISQNRFVSTIIDTESKPRAIVCVSLQDFVPSSVEELFKQPDVPTTAIFYTIWSYVPGAASELIFSTVAAIKELYPSITRFVTLSPKTDMARKFHFKNGAIEFRENLDTINYEYRQES